MMGNQKYDVHISDEAPFRGFSGENFTIKFESDGQHDHLMLYLNDEIIVKMHLLKDAIHIFPRDGYKLDGHIGTDFAAVDLEKDWTNAHI